MTETRAFTVALTGGIASGKSAVERRFTALGASILDSDMVARELVKRGAPALDAIVTEFGIRMLDADGRLDRAAMREHVFADDRARSRLEAILHPRIREALFERSRQVAGAYCVMAIPLLVENSRHYDWADRVLVVDVTPEIQIERLMSRDDISRSLAESMLGAQASREARIAIADDVIDNNGPPAALDAQILALHQNYCELAQRKRVN